MTTPDTENVRTLDDLRVWSRPAPSFAAIGHPIAHSRSPRMHNAALAHLSAEGVLPVGFEGAAYYKFDIAPERLAEALPLFREKGFVGLNLTIPHKVEALALVRDMTATGRGAGAVNTLVPAPAGGWFGHNTDGTGFRLAAKARLGGLSLAGRPVVILGAGGAARAIAAACLDAELGACASLRVLARDPAKAGAFVGFFRNNVAGVPVDTAGFDVGALPAGAVVVNCTPLGLKPGDAAPIDTALLRPGMAVYDTTYGDRPSALVAAARAAGLPAESGLSMLCAQGAEALRCWLDPRWSVTSPVPEARAVESVMYAAIGGEGPFVR